MEEGIFLKNVEKAIKNLCYDVNYEKKNIFKNNVLLNSFDVEEIEFNLFVNNLSSEYITYLRDQNTNYNFEITKNKVFKDIKSNRSDNREITIEYNKHNLSNCEISFNNFIELRSKYDYISDYIWTDTMGRGLIDANKEHIDKYVFSNRFDSVEKPKIFVNYFENYKNFISIASNLINEAYRNNNAQQSEIIIIKFDMTKYYENMNMDYINTILDNVSEDEAEEYNTINELVKYYINSATETTGLPIGLESSKVIASLYATPLDELLLSKNPLAYARYVDDIIIAFPYQTGKSKLKDYVPEVQNENNPYEEKIVCTTSNNNDIEFLINQEKTRAFVITNDMPEAHINTFEKLLWLTSSDSFLFPDIFNIKDVDLLKIDSSIKEEMSTTETNCLIIKQVLGILKRKIFEERYVDKLISNFEKNQILKDENILQSLHKINSIMDDKLFISIADYWQHMLYIDNKLESIGENKIFNVQTRINNFKYIHQEDYDALINIYMSIEELLDKSENFNQMLVNEKSYYRQILNINMMIAENVENLENNDAEDMFVKELEEMSSDSKYSNMDISEVEGKESINVALCVEKDENLIEYIKETLLRRPTSSLKWNIRKNDTVNEIFNSIRQEDDILVLPELSIRWKDLIGMINLSKKKKIIITGGMEFLVLCNRVYNYLVTIIPSDEHNGFPSVFFRLKICPAPSEVEMIEKVIDPLTRKNYSVISSKKDKTTPYSLSKYFTFESLICYEAYDIRLRSSINNQTSVIILHEHNQDIEVFDKLSRSLLTDHKAIVVQSNYSNFGDIGIFQPKKSFDRDLIKIKGGMNHFIVREKLDLIGLYKARHDQKFSELNKYKPNPPKIN